MTHLSEGDAAPIITGLDQNGKTISAADYKGKKVILYFYPKDMTPGCTVESCNLRDNYSELQKDGYEVIGVSADSQIRHQKFIAKHDLPFTLISDENKDLLNAFGVWGPKKFMGKTYDGIHRTTFVIDENGKVAKVFKKVKTKDHTNQILDEMNS